MRLTGGRSMSELAATLQNWTERRIVDRTGLEGDYELELEFDFWAWAIERYEAAIAEFKSPSFDWLIEDVYATD